MKRCLIPIALTMVFWACGTEQSPGPSGDCVPSGNEGPCNEGEQIPCTFCAPDAGAIIGVQECGPDGGGYGGCQP